MVEWLPLFTTAACCDVLVQALVHCRASRALQVHAWVILDTHFHAIISGVELAATLHALRRHTARALLAEVEREGRGWLLNQLAYYKTPHKMRSQH